MKKSILFITIISASFSTSAINGQFNVCYQHNESVGFVRSASNDPTVLGQMCFDKLSDTAPAKGRESILSHDEYSPECWEGKKDDPVGNEGGN